MLDFPKVDVKKLIEKDSFIDSYMSAMGADGAVPEVFNFFCAMQVLGMAPGRQVVLERQRPVFANVSMCLVGDTSSGKTTAEQRMRAFLRKAMPYNSDLHTGIKFISGTGSGEALIASHVGRVSDPTAAKDTPPRIVPINSLILFGEFDQFMQKSRVTGSTLRTVLFKFTDSEKDAQTDTRTHGTETSVNHYASFFTTTQPKLMRRIFTKEDGASGLANRIWFPYAESIDKPFIDEMDDEDLNFGTAAHRYEAILEWVTGFMATIEKPKVLKYEPEAIEMANEWYKEWLLPAREADESGMLERLPVHAKRIMLLMALNSRSEFITPGHVQRAITIIEFLHACYAQINWRLGLTDDLDLADDILEKVKSSSKPLSRRALYDSLRRRHKLTSPAQLARLLDDLVKLEVLEGQPFGGARGRRATVYALPD